MDLSAARFLADLHRALVVAGHLDAAAVVAMGLLDTLELENGRQVLTMTSGPSIVLISTVQRQHPEVGPIISEVAHG